jgi:hypothetical protein
MTLKTYTALASALVLAVALFLFPEMRSWFDGWPFLLLYIMAGLVMFAPIVIAKRRHHRNYWPIVILTFLCWPVALIWSLMSNGEG